jgi:RNA polymerase sigma-70 factor (ECF subfamily)
MLSDTFRTPSEAERRLGAARAGSCEALGELLETYRSYLLLVANEELPARLRPKVAASDLVQQTFLLAQDNFEQFHDHTAGELLAWLKRILIHQLIDANRKFCGAEKRKISRECSWHTEGCGDCLQLESPDRTPARQSIANEEAEALVAALDRLPDEYRRAVVLRSWQQLPFAEVGKRLGRSGEAARKLWARAVERLRHELDAWEDESRGGRHK